MGNKAAKNGDDGHTNGRTLQSKVENLVFGIFTESGIQERLREGLHQLVAEEVQQAVMNVQETVARALGLPTPPPHSKPPTSRQASVASAASLPAARRPGRPPTTGASVGRYRGAYSPTSGPGRIEKLLKEADGPMTAVEIGKKIWPELPERESRRRASIAVASVNGLKRSGPPRERLYSV